MPPPSSPPAPPPPLLRESFRGRFRLSGQARDSAGCTCPPQARGTEATPQKAGVRVSAEGVRCLFCHKAIASPLEQKAGEFEPATHPSPPEPERSALWRQFRDLSERSQGGRMDLDEAWTEFQRFLQSGAFPEASAGQAA